MLRSRSRLVPCRQGSSSGFGGLVAPRASALALLHGKPRDRLWLVVVEQQEVVLLQVPDRIALRVAHYHAHFHQVHLHLERLYFFVRAHFRHIGSGFLRSGARRFARLRGCRLCQLPRQPRTMTEQHKATGAQTNPSYLPFWQFTTVVGDDVMGTSSGSPGCSTDERGKGSALGIWPWCWHWPNRTSECAAS